MRASSKFGPRPALLAQSARAAGGRVSGACTQVALRAVFDDARPCVSLSEFYMQRRFRRSLGRGARTAFRPPVYSIS